MVITNQGDLKFPPRSYQSFGDSNLNPECLRHQRSEIQRPDLGASTNLGDSPSMDYLSADGLRPLQLVKPDYRSTILDDWTWESFSIGVGAGAIHIILADLNHNNKKLMICFEVFFYFMLPSSHTPTPKAGVNSYLKLDNSTKEQPFASGRSDTDLLQAGWSGAEPFVGSTVTLCYSSGRASPRCKDYVLAPHCLMWFKIPHFLEELQPNFYLLPIPILLTGVMAVHLLDTMPVESTQSLHVLLTGYLFGGFGAALAIFYLFTYFLRMILHGHGNGDQTAGSILVAGMLGKDVLTFLLSPPRLNPSRISTTQFGRTLGFSAHAMIGLGKNSRIIFADSKNIKLNDTLGEVWYGSGLLTGLFLLGLSFAVLFMAVSNSWWKAARNPRPNLTLWVTSTTCCSWAITSACSSLYETFESTWLRVLQITFVTGGIAFYLAILPLMIIRYFKRIGRTQTVSRIFPPTRFAQHSPDLTHNSGPPPFMNHHFNFTQRNQPSSHLESRSSISKNSQSRNSIISQETLVKI
ncbi:hypothetical protein MJO29_000055 [Puccinia striiformis f. sp. tritici]|nr:hypothetical protein MJO29_000055 [Puccinia striiformis f. sp. tritici]